MIRRDMSGSYRRPLGLQLSEHIEQDAAIEPGCKIGLEGGVEALRLRGTNRAASVVIKGLEPRHGGWRKKDGRKEPCSCLPVICPTGSSFPTICSRSRSIQEE
jgi:hypothetical protein